MSVKGVLRGLHFQKNFPQAKLVIVIKGPVFDVAVDLSSGIGQGKDMNDKNGSKSG